jgi:hypothetical protein
LKEGRRDGDYSGAEFRALRDAIGRRGQLKTTLFLTGLVAWAAALLVCLIALPYPLVSVVPLALLLATFEAIRPLHFGAERIGRYLQAFHEERENPGGAPLAPPAWEQTAMAFGPGVPGAAGHPLFAPVFALATMVNSLAILFPGPVPVELVLLSVPHAAFLAWLVYADRAMRSQRAADLERYRALRDGVTEATKGTKATKGMN